MLQNLSSAAVVIETLRVKRHCSKQCEPKSDYSTLFVCTPSPLPYLSYYARYFFLPSFVTGSLPRMKFPTFINRTNSFFVLRVVMWYFSLFIKTLREHVLLVNS